MSGSHDVALICLNGHVITSGLRLSPELAQARCSRCGEETTSSCVSCGESIRGYYSVPGVIAFHEYQRPAFCHGCGECFPWTKSMVEAARDLALEESALNEDERKAWATTLDDLIADTPRTQLAAVRFKKYFAKAGAATAAAMREIVVEIASEAAKKVLFPDR